MANADKSISDLATASTINNSDFVELSQDTGNGKVSLKATILALATKILTNINFTSALTTTDKTITGAINEIAEGGGGGGTDVIANDFDSTSTYAVGDYCIYNGSLYKCTTAVTTAGDWDSSDWTETLVMDEVESGGGGGTGGHTIIDENGNSMTARAGLQFVGGANVSDDSTNNKTIVDLASAGGIDGVFIDTDNIVKNDFTLDGNAHDWVVTEDCILQGKFMPISSSAGAYINADNISLFVTYQTNQITAFLIPIKKGQTISYKSLSGNSTYTASMVAYGIQTGTTHSKFQPIIYSTEEREIGVWTDGKPLYAKTFEFDSTDLQSETYGKYIDLTINNIEKVCLSTITLEDGMLELPYYQSSSLYITAFPILSTNKCTFKFRYGSDVASYLSDYFANSKIIIYYTKTTDTAGSGDWTPQGVPTHHYSTDEQVIGTWIDGSTLYEKTFTTSNTTQNAEVNIDASSLNIDTCVYVGGIYTRKGTGYSFKYPFGQLEPNSSPQIGSFIRYGDINKNITYKIVLSTNESTDYQHITIQYTKSS